MKKIQYILLLLAFSGLSLSSCKKFLDVEPEFLFPAEFAINDINDLNQVTTAAFNAIQSGSIYGGGLIANSEFLADHVDLSEPISDFSLNQLRTRSMNTFNGQAGGLWGDAYRAINIANIVLDSLPAFSSQDTLLAQRLKGEALFIRAICHFELLRMFAQPAGFTAGNTHLGIPIRTTPGSSTEGNNVARSSVAEVYDFIIEDLEEAAILLPAEQNVRASSYAAEAFLAKVYFQLNDFTNAHTYANSVIESGVFELDSLVKAPFELEGADWGNEMIFQIVNIDDDRSNGDLGKFRGNDNAQFKVEEDLTLLLDAAKLNSDERANKLFVQLASFLPWWTNKYSFEELNVPVVRLSELYLTRAECRLELGYPAADIRDDYNMTRVRAGLPADTSTTDPIIMETVIRNERALELAYEGDRFHDVKRRQGTFNTELGSYEWNDPLLVYPIPQQEVDQNPNMIQNDGY